MRFRLYCCFDDDEIDDFASSSKRRGTFIEMQTGSPLTSQPRQHSESIELDNIPSNSTRTSIVKNTIPITRSDPNLTDVNESSIVTSFQTPVTDFTIPVILSTTPALSATSNFSYISKNGERTKMTFDQLEPGYYRGTYKGNQFTIINGVLKSRDDIYSEYDKELIMENYSQATLALQQGLIGMEAKILEQLNRKRPIMNLRQLMLLGIPPNLKINVKFTSDDGEKSKMTFKQIKPGLFRGTFNDQEFSIANEQVFTLDGADHGLNKKLILSSFYRALLGMEQTKLGMQQGEMAMEARLSGNQLNPMELLKAACPERRTQFETESLKVHNEYRQMHGVPPLVHSEFLCEMAREWAEHLALKDKSYHRPNSSYGENLHFSNGVDMDARTTVTVWYDEINLYNYDEPELSKETGHFTQLVWKDTREMGTGIAQLGDKTWVCCYYYPPGNIEAKFNESNVPRPRENS